MLPYQMIAGGQFTVSTATIASGVSVECQAQNPPDYILLKAITGYGRASNASAIEWWWERSMAQGSAKGILQSSEGSTPQLPAMTAYTISANGIYTYDTENPPTFPGLAATAISCNTGAFVVTMASTGTIQVGDYVRLTGVTGALQISGYSFQVTAVTKDTNITLGYMASSGITFPAATAATVTKYIPKRFYPRLRFIANITQAVQAKIYFTAQNDFTPGERVAVKLGTNFGMTQINNKEVRVLSVVNTATESSIVIDLDTTGYTAFSFPLSANYKQIINPAIVVPSASAVVPFNGSATVPQEPPGTNLLDAFDNRSKRIIQFSYGLFNVSGHVSTDGDSWMWQAFKYDDYRQGTL